ncbi:hypothetical protein EIP91_008231 [Steccherinum ochraceum]|uniref:F-box domain-containing protein n=1 Tax=Steccherinum ochraceum TaxID=92696 RepID=A0A4R0R5H6_9APHY|nr:hypothetical protein EIP91_008231 [Steccherinum ochraceum]
MPPKKRVKRKAVASQQSPASRRAIHFPDEIVDYILSFLDLDDYVTPRNSSRVCRAWSAIARPYVFRTVCIRDEAQATEFLIYLMKHSIVRRWVQTLRIVEPRGDFWILWRTADFVNMVKSLKSLSALSIEDADIDLGDTDRRVLGKRKPLPGLPGVRKIFFKRCSSREESVIRFLEWFPNVQSVSLDLTECPYRLNHQNIHLQPPSASPKVGPPLVSLTISHLSPRIQPSLLPASLQSLRHLYLDLDLYDICGHTALRFVLAHIGASLQTLHLALLPSGMDHWIGLDALLDEWDANHLTGLREVALSMHAGDSLATRFLEKLRNLSIEVLIVKISFDFLSNLPRGSLDVVFQPPAFQDLKACRFVYVGKVAPQLARKRLYEAMPSLQEKNFAVQFRKERLVKGCNELNDLLRISRSLDEQDRLSVLRDMVAETPVMAFWVREVRIREPRRILSPKATRSRPAASDFWCLWTTPANVQFMESLKNLRTLVFARVDRMILGRFKPEVESALARSLPRITTVTEIVLDDCLIPSQLFSPFVRCLPSLTSLSFIGSTVADQASSANMQQTYGSLPRLRELSIDDESQGHFTFSRSAAAFLTSHTLKGVQSLSISLSIHRGQSHHDAILGIKTFLDLTWDSLRDLDIELHCIQAVDEEIELMLSEWDPMKMASLRRVQLKSETTHRDLYSWIAFVQALLSKMKVLSIEEVSLRISFDFLRDFKPESFCDFNEAIASSGYSSLRVLRFAYGGQLASKKIRDRIHQVLPSLEEKGIILDFKKFAKDSSMRP